MFGEVKNLKVLWFASLGGSWEAGRVDLNLKIRYEIDTYLFFTVKNKCLVAFYELMFKIKVASDNFGILLFTAPYRWQPSYRARQRQEDIL